MSDLSAGGGDAPIRPAWTAYLDDILTRRGQSLQQFAEDNDINFLELEAVYDRGARITMEMDSLLADAVHVVRGFWILLQRGIEG